VSDRELEALRQKKLMELKKLLQRKEKEKTEEKRVDPQQILNQFFIGRAWEVLNAAKAQYPQVARYVENVLVRLIMEGKIRNKISGEELYGLFRRLGVRVRLRTRIKILEHGKLKSLEEKIREQTSV
jgi:programmed cell death protein 5